MCDPEVATFFKIILRVANWWFNIADTAVRPKKVFQKIKYDNIEDVSQILMKTHK